MNKTQIIQAIESMFVAAYADASITLKDFDIDSLVAPVEREDRMITDAGIKAREESPVNPAFIVEAGSYNIHETDDEQYLALKVVGSPVQLLQIESTKTEWTYLVNITAVDMSVEALAKLSLVLQERMATVSAIVQARRSAKEAILAQIEAEHQASLPALKAERQKQATALSDLILAA